MSTHELLVDSGDPDWSVKENVKERRHATHVPEGAADGALKVTRNTGSLGSGSNTLSVAAGPAVVNGTEYSITQQSVDIAQGDTRPRRDVVYVDITGALDVLRGTPASPQWSDGVADTQQTIANAYLPAPRSMASTQGVALAIITAPGSGATSLNSGSHVIEDIRPHERPRGDDLDEAFANGEFGYRRLSEFDTLQAALDYSDQQATPIFVDGQFTTSETNVTLARQTILFGHAGDRISSGSSLITVDSSTSGPLFEIPDQNNVSMQWSGVKFYNSGGTPRQFMRPVSGFSGFIGSNTYWRDITINHFGGDPYTVSLDSAYAATLDNVRVFNTNQTAHGAFKFQNCNANSWSGIKANGTNPTDGETPVVYISQCRALAIDGLQVESQTMDTDAAIQIDSGSVTLVAPHVEAHNDPGPNAALQLGDGGRTQGNTNGNTVGGPTTRGAVFQIINPVFHALQGSKNEAYRVLNANQTIIDGGENRPTDLHYGGSNDDAQGDLTISPGSVTVRGVSDLGVTNPTSGSAQVSVQNGAVFASTADADAGLVPFETARVDDGSAVRFAHKDESGDLHVFRAAGDPRRETVVGPITANHTASHGEVIFCDTSGGSVTVTLPSAGAGKRVSCDNSLSSSGNSMVIETPGSGTIEDKTSMSIGSQNASIIAVCDGTNWWTLSS